MRLIWRGLLPIAFATSGLMPAQAAVTETAARHAVVVLQHGACERRCAVDRMILLGDGTALYVGLHFTQISGVRSFKVAPQAIFDLISQAEAMSFFAPDAQADLVHGACTGQADPDAPTDRLAITVDDRAAAVMIGHTCPGSEAASLTSLEHAIETIFLKELGGDRRSARHRPTSKTGKSP